MTSNLITRYVVIFAVLGTAVLCITMNNINLGIDLRGGSILTYEVKQLSAAGAIVDELGNVQERDIEDTIAVISERINQEGVKDISVRQEGEQLVVLYLPDFTDAETDKIRQRMTQVGRLAFPIVAADTDEGYDGFRFNERTENTKRENALKAGQVFQAPRGFQWFPSRPERLKGESEDAYRDRIAEYSAKLRDPAQQLELEGNWLYFDPDFWDSEQGLNGFTGKDISDPQRQTDQQGGRAVGYKVKEASQIPFAAYTEKHRGRLMALVLNGEVWSAASIEGVLRDNVQIHKGGGGYTQEEQDWLIQCLQAGSLKLKPNLLSQERIGATLGQTAISRGYLAFLISSVAIILFMLFYYRFCGILAIIGLAVNFLLIFGVLMLLEASITLPGIAGLVLTVGMAVDANILIFERIREELEKGKTLGHAAKNGFDRAFVTIFDANLTTFIVAAFLVAYGTGPIKGFGYTLMTGIICTMFAALYVTRTLMGTAIKAGWIKSLSMAQVIKDAAFDFGAVAKKAIVLSVILVAGGILVSTLTGREKYGLDFNGGTSVRLAFVEPTTEGVVKDLVAAIKDEAGAQKYSHIHATLLEPVDGKSRVIDLSLDYHPEKVAHTGDEFGGTDEFALIKRELAEKFAGQLIADALVNEAYSTESGIWRATLNLERPAEDSTKIMAAMTRAQLPAATATMVEGSDGRAWNVSARVVPEARDGVAASLMEATRESGSGLTISNPFPKARFLGPKVVADLKQSAFKAMLISLIFILGYIWFRFKELKYGFAAAVALVHDVTVAMGITVACNVSGLVNVPITLDVVAAFLTIIGYSLNDTIIVFDRIRENLGNVKGTFAEVVNKSINQTLSRTILTSATTAMVVATVFFLSIGQESPLEGLAFALLIGIIVGTYSSIFVASPMLVWLHEREVTKASEAAKGRPKPATV